MKTLGTSQTYTNDPIKGTFTTTVDMNQVSEIFENHNIINDLDFDKKETIEEVSERILANNIDGLRDALKDDDLFYFYKGVIQSYGEAMAKWQQEQDKDKFSEEQVLEMIKLRLKFFGIATTDSENLKWFKWFNQF